MAETKTDEAQEEEKEAKTRLRIARSFEMQTIPWSNRSLTAESISSTKNAVSPKITTFGYQTGLYSLFWSDQDSFPLTWRKKLALKVESSVALKPHKTGQGEFGTIATFPSESIHENTPFTTETFFTDSEDIPLLVPHFCSCL